jgi:hypothetical protein
MKTTTATITTTYAAAAKAAATKFVSVISAALSSRLGWRHDVGVFNPGVVGQRLRSLAHGLGMRGASPAMATLGRPCGSCRGSRPSDSVSRRALSEV